MGKGSKSTSTSYSGSSNPAFQPAALAGVGNVNQVYNQAQPGLQALTGIAQNQAVPSLLNTFNAGAGTAGQANQYNSDVLSGKYMNGNPYIQSILQQLNSQVSNDVNSQFSLAGRYGSGAHTDVLSKNLANADSNLLYGNYADEMNRMGQSAQSAQSGNIANAGMLQSMLGLGAQLPYTGSESLANSLGALFSGGQDKSVAKQGSNTLGQILGAAAQIGSAAIMASDPRLKTNIEYIGDWDDRGDGLKRARWNWKADPNGPKVEGVLSTDVKALRPAAYVPNFRGDDMDGVNYAMLKYA
jgi:hypothetical protein